MRCWKIVTIAGSIGKIAVVNSRFHDTFVSSNNRLLNCLSFLDRFSLRPLNMMKWEIGGSNSESQGVRDVVDGLNNSVRINILVGSSNNSMTMTIKTSSSSMTITMAPSMT